MKLYQYNHCPFCVRVDMVANYKDISHEKVYLLNDDEETCYRLVNAKKVPIIELDDGTAFAESLDIAHYLDEIGDKSKIIRPKQENTHYERILNSVEESMWCLLFPRNIMIGLPEFATRDARDYFQIRKEKLIHRSFEVALKETPQHKKQVEQALEQLHDLPLPSEHNDTISWDDVLLYPKLRNLTMVLDMRFPESVKRYLEEVSSATSTHTFFNFEI